MNIFKIDSQGLINDSQNTEDIFSRSILDEERVFSMQRFADVVFSSDTAGVKLEAANSLTGVLTAYTLGRAAADNSDVTVFSPVTNGNNVTSYTIGNGSDIYISPLIGGGASSDSKFADASYKFSVYSDTGIGYQIAIAYNGLEAGTEIGIAGVNETWFKNAYANDFASSTFVISDGAVTGGTVNISATGVWNSYSDVYKLAASDVTYLSLRHEIGAAAGSEYTLGNSFKIGDSNVTVDFYDARLNNGSYTYKGTAAKSIDFVASETAAFTLAEGKSLGLTINRTGVTVNAKKAITADDLFTINTLNTRGPQSFTGINASSDAWVSFSVYGGAQSDVGVSLGGSLYKNLSSANTSSDGTVTFGATDTTNFIELSKGKFVADASSDATYYLANNATATLAFAAGTYAVDLDGSGTTFAPMNLVASTAGSATFVAGSSDIQVFNGLAGTLSFTSETTIALGLNGSDLSKQLTFTGSDDASIGFTYNITNVKLGGTFTKVETTDTNKAITGFGFELSDTTYAKLGVISVSDTKDSASSFVYFGTTSDTATLGGAMSISTEAGITFAMSDNALVTAGALTFSDTKADELSSFKFNNSTDIYLAGTLAVAQGASDMTKVFTGYKFEISDTGLAQLGLVQVSDTANSSNTVITFANSEITLSGGGATITFSDTSAYTNYTYYLSDTGTYSIQGYEFTVPNGKGGSGASNSVVFSPVGHLTYTTAHTDTTDIFSVITTDTAAGFKLGANIQSSGGNTVESGTARLFGTGDVKVYVAASNTAVTFTLDGTDATIVGSGFQISGVSGTNLVGIPTGYKFTTSDTGTQGGVFFVADGGSDVTINSLTFSEVSDGTITKLALGATTDTFTVQGNLTLTAGSNTAATYTLSDYVTGKLSSIGINGIKFESSDSTIVNGAGGSYTLTTSDSGLLTITGTDSKNATTYTWANGKGTLKFADISLVASDGGSFTSTLIGIGSGVAIANAMLYTIGGSDVKITDGTNQTDAYKITLGSTGVAQISEIDGGAKLSAVGGAAAVVTSSSGTFTFETYSTKTGIYQAFNISGDSDVTFTLSSEGLVTKISNIAQDAIIAVTDTVTASGPVTQGTNYWAKTFTLVDTYERSTDSGKWGQLTFDQYVVNSDSGFSLTGYTADGESETASFSAGTISQDGTTLKMSDMTKAYTFQNTKGAAAYDVYSDTAGLFSLTKTTGNIGVRYSDNTLALVTVGATDTTAFATKDKLGKDSISLTLSDTALTVYTGFVVSGTNVALTANSETVGVGATAKDGAYVNMTVANDTIQFTSSDSGLYSIYSDTLVQEFSIATGATGSAIGTDSTIFTLALADGASVTDTTKLATDQLIVNGITYKGTGADVTYAITSATDSTGSDTLSVISGKLGVGQSDASYLSGITINLASNAELVLGNFTYKASDTAVTLTIGESDTTQIAKVSSNGLLQVSVTSDTAFFFNDAIYTATSDIASFVIDSDTTSTKDYLLEGTSATGKTAAAQTETVIGNIFTLASDTAFTLVYDTADTETYSKQTFAAGIAATSDALKGGTFYISDKYLTGSSDATAEQIYTYTVSDTGTLSFALDSETIALNAVVGTRAGTSSETSFSFVQYGETYTFNKTSDSTLTFSITSETAAAVGTFYAGKGTRTLGSDTTGISLASGTAISYQGNLYAPQSDATMTLSVTNGVGSETFTAGSGKFTVTPTSNNTTFYYDFLDSDGKVVSGGDGTPETLTAVSDVTIIANFKTPSDATITSISGWASLQWDSETSYTIPTLSDTYTLSASTWTVNLNGGVGSEIKTLSAGTGTFNVATEVAFHVSDKYLGITSSDSKVYEYTATTAGSLTWNVASDTIAFDAALVGERADSETGKFSFTQYGQSYEYIASDTLTFAISSETAAASGAVGSIYAGIGTRTLAADDVTAASDTTLKFNSDTYSPSTGAIMTLNVTAGAGTETFTAGVGVYNALVADSDTFHFSLNGTDVNIYTATKDVELTAYFTDTTHAAWTKATGAGVRTVTDTETYVIAALSDTYILSSADKTLMFAENGAIGAASETMTAGTGKLSVDKGGVFHIASNYIGGSDTTVYEYKASDTGILTYNMYAADSETISLGTVVGIRTDTGKFSFDQYGQTYEYTAADSDVLTFSLKASDTVAAGSIYEGIGTRALGEDFALASDTTLSWNSDTYSPSSGAIMTLEVTAGAGSETFTAGTGVFTAAAGSDTFHFKLGDVLNTYKATSDVTLTATFTNATDATLASAKGAGTRIVDGTETYVIAALSDTYIVNGAVKTLTLTDADIATVSETTTAGTGKWAVVASDTFHIASNYIGGSDTKVYEYTVTTPGELTFDIASETIKLNAVVGERADSDTKEFSFNLNGKDHDYIKTSSDTLTFSINGSDTNAYGVLVAGTGIRALTEEEVGSSDIEVIEYLGNKYTPDAEATMTVVIEASKGTETFTAGTGTFKAANGDTFYYDFLDSDGNIAKDGIAEKMTAVSEVTIQATFTEGSTDATIINISGQATLEWNSETSYTVPTLSDTYKLSASNWTVAFAGVDSEPTMTLSSGNGTLTAMEGTVFHINDSYLGVGSDSKVYEYTTMSDGTLTYTMAGIGSETITFDAALVGTRVSNADSETFTFNSKEYTSIGSMTYMINADKATANGAFGEVYSGEGTRAFTAGSETADAIVYNSDTYTVSGGTYQIALTGGEGSESLISATAAFTSSDTKDVFHYALGTETAKEYTVFDSIALNITQEGTGTTLTSAEGNGLRNAESETFAISALGDNEYTFNNDGKVKLAIASFGSETETIYSGKGTYTPTASDVAIAQFDASGNVTSDGTVYSYTSFADATFEITLASETVVTNQMLKSGSATRTSDGEDFTFNNIAYTAEGTTADADAASMTFVLDADNAATYGAAGEIFSGVGYRTSTDTQIYSGTETQNTYSFNNAEMRLTLDNGSDTEIVFNGTASEIFAKDKTFMYEGTQYTAQSDGVILQLDIVNGVANETGLSGTGAFEAKSDSETFTYESNLYTAASGTQLAVTFGGSETGVPTLVKGSGTRNMNESDTTFVYTDKNTYTLTSKDGTLKVDKPTESDSVTTIFSAGTGTLVAAAGDTFNFTFNGTEYQYTQSDATVQIVGSDTEAIVTFEGGHALRSDTTTGLEFTFDNNTYTLNSDSALTYTLNKDSGTLVETATGGKGRRTLNTGKFTYTSPISLQTETYTTSGVVLEVEINGEDGTETFISGAGTRELESGEFVYSAAKLGGESATYTGSATYELTLKDAESQSTDSMLLNLMGYDFEVVTETLTQAAGTTTVTNPTYTSLRTNESATYTGEVTFGLNVENGSETVTWESGSATMQVAIGNIFNYQLEGAEVATYTVKEDATFTRTSEENETLSGGSGVRDAKDGESFTVEYNSDTYASAASSTIVLKLDESGTGVVEVLDAGSATFTANSGDTFHYTVDGTTRAYVANELTTLEVSVENGEAQDIINASGAGTRGFEESETTVYTVLEDNDYTVTSGVFTLTLDSETFASPSETLTEGNGVFTAAEGETFNLNNTVLGFEGDSTTYTYDALSATTLNLTLKDGTERVAIESGLGTRSDYVESFTFKGNAYTASDDVVYSIDSDATVASGELYNAVGSRTAEDATGTTVFNSDTYTMDNGILTLTVKEGVGEEKMTEGTATYVAKSGDAFHYGSDEENIKAYTAIENTTLQVYVEDESNTQLVAINGAGTRTADETDVSNTDLTYTFQEDTYNATTGTKILLTATDDVAEDEIIYSSTGVVAMDVATDEEFHKGEYTYTAGSDVTISLNLSDSVRTFESNPYATRMDDEAETFTYKSKTYTTEDGVQYMLEGTGVESNLSETLVVATGSREDVVGEEYVSALENTYTLTSGTYGVTVEGGTGDESLLSGEGSATYTSGTSFKYKTVETDEDTGEETTSTTVYAAQNAVLTMSHDDEGTIEVLVSGAGYDSVNGNYILAADSTLDASATAGNAAVSVSGGDEIATIAADATNGITSLSSGELNAAVTADSTLKVNGKTYSGAESGNVVFNTELNSATAGSGTISAEGDFTGDSNPELAGKTVGIENDTDVSVVFDTSSITTLDKLSDGVNVTKAEGATKAITDSEGTFNFANSASQTFVVEADSEVIFQLDSNGVVMGITSLDKGATVTITDNENVTPITISDVGQVLTRDSETGLWTETAVEATSYIIEVDSDANIAYSAIDVHGDKTKVNASVVGSAEGTTITLKDGLTAETPVIVTNESTSLVNLKGHVEGIGKTNGAVVRIDSDTTAEGAFKTGTLSGTNFTLAESYTVTGAALEVTSSGEILVDSQGDAAVAVSDTSKVTLIADTNTDKFTINEGPTMTMTVADADGVGYYALQGSDSITGLTPSEVDTGTVVIPTNAEDGTKFAINSDSVNVTGDGDGMTLEIATNTLVGLSDIDTNATIAASVSGDTLSVNGDEVALTSDPIKYNATNDKWLSGSAPAAEGVIGYLVQVNADGTVALSYQTTDTIKATANVADYKVVFADDYAPDEDGGALKPYGNEINLNALGSDISVSVAADNGAVVVNTASGESRDLILTTADATYTVNTQEIIPSGEVTVTASEDTAKVMLNAKTTIGHDDMTFDATTDSAILFTNETIYLNDTAKVTNTDASKVFNAHGTVGFDSVVVVTGNTESGTTITNVRTDGDSETSGLTVNEEELNITGDFAYTLNVAGSDTVISGISAPATVSGTLADNAQIVTDAEGTYQVGTNTSKAFTITGDSDGVVFKTTDGVVTAIDSLNGTATGDFNNISVDGKSVVIYNDIDSVQAVTANGEKVTDITGVGNANSDVVIANAGGASLVTTNQHGGITFGASSINRQHYSVNDADSVVSFLTSELEDYTPSVSGVQGLEDGTIAISQNEANGFAVNDEKVTLTAVGSSDVTLNVAGSAIVSVNGLTGGINGINNGVAVEITDGDVTINGAEIAIGEPNGTNVIYTSTADDTGTTNVITGLNKDAAVYVAANMNILTEEEGTFTFNNGVYTITGDDNVTFETDQNSNVKNVANVVGTVQSSASDNTINGAAMSTTDTDVTIVAAGSGISSVLGVGDGDSVTVPEGTSVEVTGSSDPTVATTFAVNGKAFEVTGDTDTLVVKADNVVEGLNPGASLKAVNTAGNYNINGSNVYASVGAVIIGDEEGTAHVYDPSDVNISSEDTPEEVIAKVTGGASTEDKYVEAMDSDVAKAALEQGGSALDGNLEMTLGGGTGTTPSDSVETADFSNSKGIKKVTMNGNGNQNVKFNDEGGNIGSIGDDATGEKNIALGDGDDLAVIGKTKASTPVNITTGKGRDTVISQGRNVKVNVGAGGSTRLMANGYGAQMEVEGYDANTGAGIQLTNNDIKAAVKKNTVQLENGEVTTSEGAKIRTAEEATEGSSVVNFYNLKGLMTKVGYTYNEGGTVDLSSSKNDVVMKGNYQENGAQQKSGSSKLVSGSGDDYVLAGAGDDIDVGEGNNEIELSPTARNNLDNGAVISQTATRGTTTVTNFNNDFSNSGDRVNINASASVQFIGGVLRFILGAATLLLNNMTASGSSADLAESADEDDSATSVDGSTDYARVLIGDATSAVKTAVASEGNWIGGSDSLWTEDNMPSAYLGTNSGISFLNSDGALDLHLGNGSDGNGEGTLDGQEISVRGISKVRLGNGSSTVYGAATTNNTIVTGLGNSSVWGGGSSNDTFIGRQTSLKSGESTFFYVDGDGKDTISNFEFFTSDNRNTTDVVNVLNTGVTGASTSGNDVIINLANSEDDRLTIKDAAGKDFVMEYGNVGSFDTLVAQVNYNSLTYDGRASYYQATGKNATLTADSGLDSVEVWLNNNRDFSPKTTFAGDINVLNASAVEGKSTLVGNGYNNSIVGSSENSSMWGGDSHEANDTLVGGAGADMFWYGKNEGNDVITGTDENDVINLYNVNIADVESYDNWNITNNSISFNMKDGGSLTIQSNNSGIGFKFADDDNTYAINQRTKEYYTK